MSYKNPSILILSSPIGIDAVIQSIQQDLYSGLTWLEKSFGRAWEFKEKDPVSGDQLKLPKCYMGEEEYMNVLPNDFLKSQSFIAVRGEEATDEYNKYGMQSHSRQLSIIFWFNLKEINSANDTVFTEFLKSDVEKILSKNPWIQSVDKYYDERAEDVFDGYVSNSLGGRYSVDDIKTQYLMYPYSGFRFDITAYYPENVECSSWNDWPATTPGGSAGSTIPDIYFRVGVTEGYDIADTTTLEITTALGKKIRLFRGGVIQTPYSNLGYYWSWNSSTAILTVNPAWAPDEDVTIQIF